MTTQINLNYKESTLDALIRSMEGLMKGTSFFLPNTSQTPLFEVAKRRKFFGLEVTHIPLLLFKIEGTLEDKCGQEKKFTLRYYFVTKDYVVNFDDSKTQHEFDDGQAAKNFLRKWIHGHKA